MAPSLSYAFWNGTENLVLLGSARADIERLLRQLSLKAQELDVKRLLNVTGASRLLVVSDFTGGTCRIVGMATLIPVETLMRRIGRVEDVVVDKEYRGRGIGRRIMELVVDEAKRLGLTRLELTSNPVRKSANKLYKSLGFKRKETNVYRLDL